MSSFEEEFPSLKGKGTAGANVNGRDTFWFWDDEIEEFTLDKQRVREAIASVWYVLFDNQEYYNKKELLRNFVVDLKKELGLEDE